MNKPPYIIEDVFTGIIAAVAAKLGRNVYSFYVPIKELNETLTQYNGSPTLFDKKYPLVLLQQPVTISSSKLPQLYGEIAKLTMFIITGSQQNYKTVQRDDINYVPIVNPIVDELKNQMILCKAFLGYPSQLKYQITKYPYWGKNQQSVLNDVVDVMQIDFLNLKIQNNLNC